MLLILKAAPIVLLENIQTAGRQRALSVEQEHFLQLERNFVSYAQQVCTQLHLVPLLSWFARIAAQACSQQADQLRVCSVGLEATVCLTFLAA